jgi:hypothetical protein
MEEHTEKDGILRLARTIGSRHGAGVIQEIGLAHSKSLKCRKDRNYKMFPSILDIPCFKGR